MNKENMKKELCDYLNFAAKQMEKYADKTCDQTLKTKYEEIAGINRGFLKKFEDEQKQGGDVGLLNEIRLLKNALICQKALYDAFCQKNLEKGSEFADELMEKQKGVCRALQNELTSRESILK